MVCLFICVFCFVLMVVIYVLVVVCVVVRLVVAFINGVILRMYVLGWCFVCCGLLCFGISLVLVGWFCNW